MQRLGQGGPSDGEAFKRILELNPDHPVVQKMRQLFEKNPDDPKLETYGRLLLDQATIAEGSTIKDPAGFARRVNELISA
jgi:molecular chaperone HtpG